MGNEIERVCVKCGRTLRLAEPMLGEGFCRDCAPPLDPNSIQRPPLTDAEVVTFLEAHKDDPIDEEQAERIEWLFREKLATDARMEIREWIEEYDCQATASGLKTARYLEQLYGNTKSLLDNAARVIETLAIQPARAATPTSPLTAEEAKERRQIAIYVVDEWRKTWRGMSDSCVTANRLDLIDRIAAELMAVATVSRDLRSRLVNLAANILKTRTFDESDPMDEKLRLWAIEAREIYDAAAPSTPSSSDCKIVLGVAGQAGCAVHTYDPTGCRFSGADLAVASTSLARRIAEKVDVYTAVTLIREAGDPEEIRAIASIVEAELAATETGWRPISEAPKDGTRVLLWCRSKLGVSAGVQTFSEHVVVGAYKRAKRYEDEDGWYGGGWRQSPTHWIPLPSPPESSNHD